MIGSLLSAPARGLIWIFEEIHKAAKEDAVDETEQIKAKLRDLYLALEAGSIAEADFDAKERELLDRLDELEGGEDEEAEDEPGDEDGDDGDADEDDDEEEDGDEDGEDGPLDGDEEEDE